MSGLAGEHNDVVRLVIFGAEVRTPTGTYVSESFGQELWCNVVTLAKVSDFLREAVDSSDAYRVLFACDPEIDFVSNELQWLTHKSGSVRRLRPQGNLVFPQDRRRTVCYVDCKDVTQDSANVMDVIS